jgi:hypothetical protein
VVDDLHGEPPLRGALLVAQNKGCGDVACHPLERGLDNSIGASNSGEGVLEEIQVALVTFRALVNNL